MTKIYITSGTTFTAPVDWPGIADEVECIGGGAGGRISDAINVGVGGGGGGYSKALNITIANGDPLQIGQGGGTNAGGTDTFLGSSMATALCGAKGGSAPSSGIPGAGGQASAGVGSTKYSGGTGGSKGTNQFSGAAGGGAAGPNGDGGTGGPGGQTGSGGGGGGNGGGGIGGTASGAFAGAGGTAWDGTPGGIGSTSLVPGTDGSHGSGGGGGSTSHPTGLTGGLGNEWDSTHGSGGGGGGPRGAGGLYGGGGGGENWPPGTGTGNGANGIIVITYTPPGIKFGDASNTLTFNHGVTPRLNGAVQLTVHQTLNLQSVLLTDLPLTSLYGTPASVFSGLAYGIGVTVNQYSSNELVMQSGARVSVVRNLSVSDTLTFSQTLVNDDTQIVSQTLTFVQSAVCSRITFAASTITFSQTVHALSGVKHPTSTLALTQVVAPRIIYGRSLFDPIVFHQVADVVHLRVASNTFTLSQSTTVDKVKWSFNVFAVTQSATLNIVHNDSASNTLVFAQSLSKSLGKPVNQTFTIHQSATVVRVKHGVASNLLVMSQLAVKTKISFAHNTLAFTQTATVQKIRPLSASNVLVLDDTVARTAVYNFSVTTPLIFLHTHQKPTNINGSLDTVPVGDVVVTKPKRRVSFRTKDRAIVLLPPELNDGEGNTGKIVLQRTITGGTYAYARRTSTRKLKYSFETDQYKALEMRRFMLDCLSDPIWVENWKGELWVGYFTNNPIEFKTTGAGQPCGDRYSFDVEFEGTRIH